MKKIFTKVFLLFLVTIFSFTFISCKKRNLGTYYEVKYEVNNQEYAKYFVEEGKLATAIIAPTVEGKEFVFWMLDNSEYDFSKPVNSNLTLVASYKDEEADGEIPNAVKTQLEKIVAGAEYTKVSITATENLKAEYKAVKDGKEVSIYYLEKANVFTTVKLYVGIDEDGKIVNMVTTQSDTLGKGESFNGSSMGLNGATSTTIDDSFVVVSGATVSSNTVKDLITIAFDKFATDHSGPVNPDEISDEVKTQLEKIVAGAEYTKVSITATENLKAEYKAVKDGKEVSIYYLEKANVFTTVKLYVGIDEDGKIVNMVTTQSDTLGKGESFNGSSMGLNGATSTTIDDSFVVVSGATVSSNTVKDLITIAFDKFMNDNPDLFPVKTLTVTFDSNGGTLVKEIEVKSGSTFVRPNDPTRSLYHFVGWYFNNQPYDFTKPVTSNITLVAKWVSVFQFDSKTQTIVDATDLAGDIEIPAKINGVEVKALGENLFKNNKTITSVIIPEGIENIAFSAFEGCSNLKTVTFLGTDSSDPLTFGINIFKDCTALNSISLPANATAITTSMFEGCTSLIQLPIHGVLDHIGTSAFKNCVQLAAISLPEGVKSIESNAFENCQSLIAISFPSTLTKISEEAFKNCSQIVSLYIPQGVTNINLNAFLGCEKLSSINVSADNKSYASVNGALYNKSLTTLYLVPDKNLTTFEVKNTVTSIQVNALANLIKLESITVEDGSSKYQVYNNVLYSTTTTSGKTTTKLEFIPAKYSQAVTLLANTKDLAANVFANCPNITEIIIEDGNEFFFEIDHLIYRKASATSTYYTLVVANRNFNGVATILKDTTGTLSSIDASAFIDTTLSGIRFTTSAHITYVSDTLFDKVLEGFKVYIPNGQTNYFVGMYNTKWSAAFKALVSTMIVEDEAQ